MCCKPAVRRACGILTATNAGSRRKRIGYSRLWRRLYLRSASRLRRLKFSAAKSRPLRKTIRWRSPSKKTPIWTSWPNASKRARASANSGLRGHDAHHAVRGGLTADFEAEVAESGGEPFGCDPQLGITAHRLAPEIFPQFRQHVMDDDGFIGVFEKAGQNPPGIGTYQYESGVSLQGPGGVITKRRGKDAALRQRGRHRSQQAFERRQAGHMCQRV